MVDQNTLSPEEITKQAEEVAAAKIEELKSGLISAISGQQPETPPPSWTALKTEIQEKAVSEAVQKAEERILSKLEAEKKSLADQAAAVALQTEEQKAAQAKREWEEMSMQYNDAVKDGIIPAVSPQVAQKLAENKNDPSKLTPEELEDPGLKAYREAAALHMQKKKEGESSSFYRTIERYYNKQPAGTKAPVIGSHVQIDNSPGYTYAEVHAKAQSL